MRGRLFVKCEEPPSGPLPDKQTSLRDVRGSACKRMRIYAAALLVLSACIEGPVGPAGPPGPPGPAGEDAALSIVLIEFSASEEAWEFNGWWNSYVFFDPRITPSSLLEVYIKKYYENTGGAYYEQFALWTAFAETTGNGSTFYQLFDGGIRFFDPARILEGRTVVVAVRA